MTGFPLENLPATRLEESVLAAIVGLGALYAWDGRNAVMNADGVCYLDMADAVTRGDWTTAVNPYWSPLYSWILAAAFLFRPSRFWEPLVVRFVNFLIYLAALACFHHFWVPLIANDPVWMIFGYAVFAWASLRLITVSVITPDLLLSALIFLALGLLDHARQTRSLEAFALAGAVLGLTYYAKTVMFPLGFVLLGWALLLPDGWHGIAVAFLFFLLVSTPWVAAVSRAKGRFTFGDAGKITYLLYVSLAKHTFTSAGQAVIGPDAPVHPLRRIHTAPDVFHAQDYPFRATCPPWYNASYWYQGAEIHFQPRAQLNQFMSAYRTYVDVFFSGGGLPAGLIVLWLIGCDWRRPDWLPLLWSLAALAIFAIVHAEPRLVAPFVVLLWLGPYLGFVSAPLAQIQAVVLVVALALLIPLLAPVPEMTVRAVRDLAGRRFAAKDWHVAQALRQFGLQTGDRVAYVSDATARYYFRLAQLVVPTWIPSEDVERFWALDAARKSAVFSSMAAVGARAVLAEEVPPGNQSDWKRIGETNVYIHPLPPLSQT